MIWFWFSNAYIIVFQEHGLDNVALEQTVFIDHIEEKHVSDLPQQPILPAHPRTLTNEEYPGPHNFEVDLDPNGSKNPWVVSVNWIMMGLDVQLAFLVFGHFTKNIYWTQHSFSCGFQV